MSFTIKSAEDLSKALGELKAQGDENAAKAAGTDERIGQFGAELAAIKTAVEKYGERRLPRRDGKTLRLPVTQKEWAKFGMKAFFNAKSGVQRTRDGFTVGKGPVARMQDAHSLAIFEAILRTKAQPSRESIMNTIAYREKYVPARDEVFAHVKEIFNITNAGEGLEWIPEHFSSELIERIRLGWKVVGLFKQVNMPGSPYVFPVFRDDISTYYYPSPTSATATEVTEGLGSVEHTDDMTFIGRRFINLLKWSWDYAEDTAIEVAGDARDSSTASMSNAWERAVLDGDSDGAHMDSDVGASTTAPWVAFDGLRKIALAGAAAKNVGGAAIDSSANWNTYVRRGVFTPMGRFGVNGADVAVITGVAVSNQARAIERFSTAEVFSNALNRLANINDGSFSPDGISDFVVSEFVRENLNGSGVYDGVTTDQTYFLVVNKKAWRVGMMPTIGFKVLDQTQAKRAQTEILFTQRGDFKQCFDFENRTTGIGYGVATS